MITLSKDQVTALLKSNVKLENEITFWYGGWSLLELRDMQPKLFYKQDWYDDEDFANKKHPEGIYTVRFIVEGSLNKTYDEQVTLIPKGETVVPIAILMTACLLSKLETGNDPLADNWSRSSDLTASGDRVSARFGADGWGVSGWGDGDADPDIALASARRLPDA